MLMSYHKSRYNRSRHKCIYSPKKDSLQHRLIYTILELLEDMEQGYKNIPRDSFIGGNSPYKQYANQWYQAERKMGLISELLNILIDILYKIGKIVKKCHIKINWEK